MTLDYQADKNRCEIMPNSIVTLWLLTPPLSPYSDLSRKADAKFELLRRSRNEVVKCLVPSRFPTESRVDCETAAAAAAAEEQTAMSHFPFSLQPTKMTTP